MHLTAPLRRLLPVLVALTLIAPAAAAQPIDQAAAMMTVVGTDRLNLRDCPETACNTITTMPLGAELRVTGEAVGGFVPADPNAPWSMAQQWPNLVAALSEQERHILDLIGEGLTNRQIGDQLFLAEKTVKNYVSSILAKLGFERRTQAAVFVAKAAGEAQPDGGGQ